MNPMCPECARLHAIIAERDNSRKSLIEGYEARLSMARDFQSRKDSMSETMSRALQAERDEYKEALFRLSRITPAPQHTPRVAPSEGGTKTEHKPIGSNRSWPDVKRKLEHSHRDPQNDAKLAHWNKVNAEAEKNIPELKTALAERELQTDLEVLNDTN